MFAFTLYVHPKIPQIRQSETMPHEGNLLDHLNNAVTIGDQTRLENPMTFKEDFNRRPKDTERLNERRERERQKLKEVPGPQPRPAPPAAWVPEPASVAPKPAETQPATVSGSGLG